MSSDPIRMRLLPILAQAERVRTQYEIDGCALARGFSHSVLIDQARRSVRHHIARMLAEHETCTAVVQINSRDANGLTGITMRGSAIALSEDGLFELLEAAFKAGQQHAEDSRPQTLEVR